ncbi:hypothetical protein O3Q52_46865 [Streptomyces sp. ActVer]|uniref:hypothetical protein n=1 Tax=Streptomyces sp. ActVer TaxID=3014558 RepID=UPI0022B2C860|nr:hypothetical protein [Streptomyces sp. ActVer]MCZ4515509.1 hypothetical protein [Streptomyces sp. ActVer]
MRGSGDLKHYSAPTVHDGLVHAFLGRTLYVVDRDGEQKWALAFSESSGAAAFQQVVDARPRSGVRVYAGTRNGIAAVDMPG